MGLLLCFLVAPRLKLDDSWSDIVILPAGKSKTYTIPYSGHPEPKITWKYNDAPELPTNATTKADSSEIVLTLKNVVRSDTGLYEIAVSVF